MKKQKNLLLILEKDKNKLNKNKYNNQKRIQNDQTFTKINPKKLREKKGLKVKRLTQILHLGGVYEFTLSD